MPQQVTVAVSDLLLDEQNARIGVESSSQQQAALALAKKQGRRLVRLAQSIQENGLDPAQLPSVIATGDRRRKYIVLEGNRRVLAIKALETPSLVQGALDASDFKKLQSLSAKYSADPIDELYCILYSLDEAEIAYAWVLRRHSGAQEGAGLVEWASDEKDRFSARHGSNKKRSLGGQALDFLATVDGAVPGEKIATNLTRILTSPEVRDKIGLVRISGELQAKYSKTETAKALRHIVDDLTSGRINVKDVYTAKDRRDYAGQLPTSALPTPSTGLEAPVRLGDLSAGNSAPAAASTKTVPATRRKRTKAPRTSVASPESKLNPASPRANAIYNELLTLSADQYKNAGAVLLRVFLEISVDDYGKRRNIMTESERHGWVLAKRMKVVADDLVANNQIDSQLKKAVYKIADSQHTLAASVTAFHQYVHNPYVHPKPSELLTSWDELQPFLEAVWA